MVKNSSAFTRFLDFSGLVLRLGEVGSLILLRSSFDDALNRIRTVTTKHNCSMTTRFGVPCSAKEVSEFEKRLKTSLPAGHANFLEMFGSLKVRPHRDDIELYEFEVFGAEEIVGATDDFRRWFEQMFGEPGETRDEVKARGSRYLEVASVHKPDDRIVAFFR